MTEPKSPAEPKMFYRVQLIKNQPLTLEFVLEDESGGYLRDCYMRPDLEIILNKLNAEPAQADKAKWQNLLEAARNVHLMHNRNACTEGNFSCDIESHRCYCPFCNALKPFEKEA